MKKKHLQSKFILWLLIAGFFFIASNSAFAAHHYYSLSGNFYSIGLNSFSPWPKVKTVVPRKTIANHKLIESFSEFQGGEVVTLNPLADAYVRGGSSTDVNWGFSTTIQIKSTTVANNKREGYIKFDLSTIPSSVDSAVLRLYMVQAASNPSSHSLRFVSDDDWTEGGITYTNQPSVGSIVTTYPVSVTGWVEIDVKSIVESEAGGTLSLHISEDNLGDQTYNYSSRQGSNKPELVVTKHTLSVPNVEMKDSISINVFPNPVSEGYFNVELNGLDSGEKVDVSIYDLAGKKLYNRELNPGENLQKIVVPNDGFIKNGVYIVKITNANTTKVEKLVMN